MHTENLNTEAKRRSELGYKTNKEIPIKKIIGINIKKFRTIQNQSIILGEHITVISGRNGSMKTSMMGLLAHPFDSESKDAFERKLKTPLNEVFKLSKVFDIDDYNYEMLLETEKKELLKEPIRIYYVGDKTNRHRVVVSGAEEGDGNFTYNTALLNLKRLYPLVDTKAKPVEAQFTSEELRALKDFYENVFPSTEYGSFTPVKDGSLKTTFAPSGENSHYDWETISSGEDNLGSIFNRLIGFQRSASLKPDLGNGIFCIDEFESSLHPVAQVRLFNYLYKWAQKHRVQIVISTHSLGLITSIYNQHKQNIDSHRVAVNFISKSSAAANNYPIIHNPPLALALKELTLEDPEKISSALKIRIFCEDEIAIHFTKRLLKNQKLLSEIEFHSSLDPESPQPGTSYTALTTVLSKYPLLVEDSLAILDPDVKSSATQKIKNKNSFLMLPDKEGIAIERRIILYITSLNNEDDFFIKFKREREAFLYSFKDAGINSLTRADILDENKTKIEQCKAWARKEKAEFKKYITYYCDHLPERAKFKEEFLQKLNSIRQKLGMPKLHLE